MSKQTPSAKADKKPAAQAQGDTDTKPADQAQGADSGNGNGNGADPVPGTVVDPAVIDKAQSELAAAVDAAPELTDEQLQEGKVWLAKAIGGSIRVLATMDGKTKAVDRKLTADDIMSFKLHPDHAVVVTIDGRKHRVEAVQ